MLVCGDADYNSRHPLSHSGHCPVENHNFFVSVEETNKKKLQREDAPCSCTILYIESNPEQQKSAHNSWLPHHRWNTVQECKGWLEPWAHSCVSCRAHTEDASWVSWWSFSWILWSGANNLRYQEPLLQTKDAISYNKLFEQLWEMQEMKESYYKKTWFNPTDWNHRKCVWDYCYWYLRATTKDF